MYEWMAFRFRFHLIRFNLHVSCSSGRTGSEFLAIRLGSMRMAGPWPLPIRFAFCFYDDDVIVNESAKDETAQRNRLTVNMATRRD